MRSTLPLAFAILASAFWLGQCADMTSRRIESKLTMIEARIYASSAELRDEMRREDRCEPSDADVLTWAYVVGQTMPPVVSFGAFRVIACFDDQQHLIDCGGGPSRVDARRAWCEAHGRRWQ